LKNPFHNKTFSKAFLAGMLFLVPALSTADTDRAKAVGSKLMCICGCQQVLTECNHIHCPSSVPMRAEVNDKLAAGMTDDQLLKSFVEKYGTAVLAAPAFSGIFNRTAWLTPFAALVIGLAGLVFYLRRIKSTAASSASPTAAATESSKYDQKIEDELNRFTPED
jgi:cytochrome c-type biogenesis protein CcmH/NrfF